MTFEFFLVLVALVVCGLAAMWLYEAIFDFVDWWKKKEPWGANIAEHPRTTELRRMTRELRKGRLPPMTHEPPVGPPDGWERRPVMPKARRMMD